MARTASRGNQDPCTYRNVLAVELGKVHQTFQKDLRKDETDRDNRMLQKRLHKPRNEAPQV